MTAGAVFETRGAAVVTVLAAADRMVDRLPEPVLNLVADLILALVSAANVVADRAARWAVAAADGVTRWVTVCTGPEADQCPRRRWAGRSARGGSAPLSGGR